MAFLLGAAPVDLEHMKKELEIVNDKLDVVKLRISTSKDGGSSSCCFEISICQKGVNRNIPKKPFNPWITYVYLTSFRN